MKNEEMRNKEINLLFICKHNIFRSKVAEAYFKKINKNKNIHVDSAGFIKGAWTKMPLHIIRIINKQKEASKKRGFKLKIQSKELSIDLLKKQDLIIIISDDLPNIFQVKEYAKKDLKVKKWKIKDIDSNNYSEKKLDYAIDQIMKKVDQLVKELKIV